MPGDTMRDTEEIQLVTFRLGTQSFAFNVFEVERVLRFEAPTRLPDAPAFLEGMLSYGEDFVPVVDLRKRLNVSAVCGQETRTVVVEWEQGKIGLVVDAVQALIRVPVKAVKAPPPLVRGLAAKYLNGVIARDGETVMVLAVSKLLTSNERLALQSLTVDSAHE